MKFNVETKLTVFLENIKAIIGGSQYECYRL
jgi:hypothetical protein